MFFAYLFPLPSCFSFFPRIVFPSTAILFCSTNYDINFHFTRKESGNILKQYKSPRAAKHPTKQPYSRRNKIQTEKGTSKQPATTHSARRIENANTKSRIRVITKNHADRPSIQPKKILTKQQQQHTYSGNQKTHIHTHISGKHQKQNKPKKKQNWL